MDLRQTIVLDTDVQERFEQKEEIATFVYNACHMWSERHPERSDSILDEQIIEHSWGVEGPEAIKTICHNTHSVFEEFQIVIEEIISEGNLESGKISCRFKALGNWVNDYCGVKANGKSLSFPGLFYWIVKDRKIKESWIYQSYVEAPELGALLLREAHSRLGIV